MRTRPKRLLMLACALAVMIAAVAPTAGANTASMQASNFGVSQTFKIDFNTGACSSGVTKIQITSGRLKWTRDNTSRKVSEAHMFLQSGYKDCSNNGVAHERHTTHHPVFGCLGRCSNLVTEELGTVVSWGYVHRSGDLNQTSGSGHGHVTDGNGNALGAICTRISLHNGPVNCQ